MLLGKSSKCWKDVNSPQLVINIIKFQWILTDQTYNKELNKIHNMTCGDEHNGQK